LAVGAPLLLLDEPTTHLDPQHQTALVRVLRREVARGTAVVSVMHDLSLALMADRLVLMCAGGVVAEGAAKDPEIHHALCAVFEDAIRIVPIDGQWIVVPKVPA